MNLQEKSKNYAKEATSVLWEEVRIAKAFRDGATYANAWIDIEQELPTTEAPVLVKTKNGYIMLVGGLNVKMGRNISEDGFKYTHWRPIEII